MSISRWVRFALLSLLLLAAGSTLAQQPFKSISVQGKGVNMIVSRDGRYLATFDTLVLHIEETQPTAAMTAVRVYAVDTGQLLWELTDATDFVMDGAFSPDNRTLVTYHQNGFIYLWDMRNGEPSQIIPAIEGVGQPVFYFSDGQRLLTRGGNFFSPHLLWNLDSGAITAVYTHRFDSRAVMMQATDGMRVEGTSKYNSVATVLSPDETHFITVTQSGYIWNWDLAEPAQNPTMLRQGTEMPDFPIRHIYFTPDGESLVYFAYYRDDALSGIYRLDIASGEEMLIHNVTTRSGFALSPDGQRVVWGDVENAALSFALLADPDTVTTVSMAEIGVTPRLWPNQIRPFVFVNEGSHLLVSGFLDENLDTPFIYLVDVPS